jgi:hypothetical protein
MSTVSSRRLRSIWSQTLVAAETMIVDCRSEQRRLRCTTHADAYLRADDSVGSGADNSAQCSPSQSDPAVVSGETPSKRRCLRFTCAAGSA